MNTNLPTTDMNIEDYEDQAIKKSKLAKGIGIAAAGAVGGAAIVAGTTYAANAGEDDTLDVPLTAEEMIPGAQIGEEIEPEPETPAQPTTQYVYIEKSEPEHETEKEPDIVWEETNNYYVDGEKIGSIEEGTYDGHDIMIADIDGDGHADYLAYDANNNHHYDVDEIIALTPQDNIHMGSPSATTNNHHYDSDLAYIGEEPSGDYIYANNESHQIHNNFEDEKTGEDYYGDFAENNPDYNPHADLDFSSSDQYLAENYEYDGGNYHASLNEIEESNVAEQPDLADNTDSYDDSFDSMMESEEFLG